MNNTPHHIAIIMDGNRRWAKRNGREAIFGHEQGAKTLKNKHFRKKSIQNTYI